MIRVDGDRGVEHALLVREHLRAREGER